MEIPALIKQHERFFKFCVVGGIGTLLNLAILYSLTEYLQVYYLASATVAFVLSATHNYLANKHWTFEEKIADQFWNKYAQFLVVSTVSLALNLLILFVLVEFLHVHYLVGQLIATFVGVFINYFGNKRWTFDQKNKKINSRR